MPGICKRNASVAAVAAIVTLQRLTDLVDPLAIRTAPSYAIAAGTCIFTSETQKC